MIQILKQKSIHPTGVPSEMEFCWIKYPWFFNSLFEVPGYKENVTSLRLWGCQFIKKANQLKFLKECSSLTGLSLQWCGFSHLLQTEVESLLLLLPKTLTSLCLSGNEIKFTQSHMEALKQIMGLKSLTLYGNSFQSNDVISCLPRQLEELSLAKTELNDSLDVNFAELFPNLRTLRLSVNKLLPTKLFQTFPISLQLLDLQRNSFNISGHEQSAKQFLNFTYLNNLEVLSLGDMNLGNGILELPEAGCSVFPPNLQELDLSGSQFTMSEELTAKLFSIFPKDVQHLDLSSNFLKFGPCLTSLSELTKLESLDLSDVNNLFEKHLNTLLEFVPDTMHKVSVTLPKYAEKFNLHAKANVQITYA